MCLFFRLWEQKALPWFDIQAILGLGADPLGNVSPIEALEDLISITDLLEQNAAYVMYIANDVATWIRAGMYQILSWTGSGRSL